MANAPADVLADAARRRLALKSGADLQRSTLEEDYKTNSGRAQEMYGERQRDVNSGFASRGMFNSGIRVDEQGKLSRDYGEQVSQLAKGRQRGLSGIDLGLQSGENDIQTMLDNAAREETQRQLNAQLQNQQQTAQQAFYNQQNAYSAQANQQQADAFNQQAAAAQALQDQQNNDLMAAIAYQQQQDLLAAIAYGQQQDAWKQKMGRPF